MKIATEYCNPLNVFFYMFLIALIRHRFLRWGPSHTHYCHAHLNVSYRLSCWVQAASFERLCDQSVTAHVALRPIAWNLFTRFSTSVRNRTKGLRYKLQSRSVELAEKKSERDSHKNNGVSLAEW